MALNLKCNKYGLIHPRPMCTALNAMCFKCHQYGHFSRVCDSNNIHRRNINSANTEKKKIRDSLRMAAFINRKDAQNLPFHDTEVNDLLKLCFNSLLRMKPQCQATFDNSIKQLQSTIDGHQSCISFLRMNNVEMKSTVQKTLEQNEKLKRERKQATSELNRKRTYAKLLLQEVGSLQKSLQTERNLQENYRIETYRLSRSIHEQQLLISKLEQDKISFKSKIDELWVLNKKLCESNQLLGEKLKAEEEDRVKDIQDPFYISAAAQLTHLSTEYCEMALPYVKNVPKHFHCQKCGSRFYHPKESCTAQSFRCQFCKRTGHYTLLCKDLKSRV